MSLGGEGIDNSSIARISLVLLATTTFRAVQRLFAEQSAEQPKGLSPREIEVLRWIAEGGRHKAIAATLRISERTVENHLRHIRLRLCVRTTAQAIQIAIKLRQIEI